MVWCTKRRISLQGMGRGRVDGIGATSGIQFAMGLDRPSRRQDTLYGGAGAKRVPLLMYVVKRVPVQAGRFSLPEWSVWWDPISFV